MTDTLLRVYHCLPGPMRSIAASARGLYLRSWRYGPGSERLVEEALERERWSFEKVKNWQEERLAYVLNRAATQVPYYRDHWAARRRRGDHASWEYLENWPLLEKEYLRQNPTAFLADDCDRRAMFHEHTSGTTGKPLDLWWSRETVQGWYALFEARCRRWYGVSKTDRWAILGGQLITSISKRRPPFWVWNAPLNQLYMSSYHLAPDLIPYYLDALKKYRVKYILGYTSALHALAQTILDREKNELKMTTAITNAEPLFSFQRQAIADALQCPVRETYGMAEIVTSASECTAGKLHLWPEVGWIEVQTSDYNEAGELVCTSLLNSDMPLIRYRVGDNAVLAAADEACSCGRNLRILRLVEGRADDLLYTSDGRRVGRLDPVFKTRLPIREAQIIQETINKIRVRYVPSGQTLTPAAAHSIVQRLQERLGAVQVLLEAVDEMPRESNGKFRSVLCNLPVEQREYLRRSRS